MDFAFNDDQLALRDSVARFLMVEAAPEVLREIWQTGAGRSPRLRAKFTEIGLTALSVPEAHGGLGLGDVDWALINEQLGYFAIPDSLAGTAYVAAGLLNALPGSERLQAQWLPRIAEGSCRIAVGHPVNPWVSDVRHADLLLIATADGGEWHALDPEKVQAASRTSIDASRRLSEIEWAPNPETRIASGDAARALSRDVLDRAALGASGQLLGLARRMLDLGVDYAAQRKQFGKPIGSFQAIKHNLADVVTQIEFALPVLGRAAYAVQHGEANRSVLVSHAKLVCGAAAWTAARKGIQVHGAMGYTWEVDLQMFMKRAWALDAAWGDRAFHKQRIAHALLDGEMACGPGSTF
jgi:alkylation response protein AidB-like acyl-CoA dehydrogenase